MLFGPPIPVVVIGFILDQGRSIVLFRSKGFDVRHSQLSIDLKLTDDKSAIGVIFYVLYQMNIMEFWLGAVRVFSRPFYGYFDEFWVTKVQWFW